MASTAGAIRAGKAFVEIFADDAKLVRGLRGAQNRLRRFGQSASALGRTMMASSAVVAAPMAFALRTFMGFDDAMLRVRAVTSATADEFAALREQVKLLGRTTSFKAVEVAGAQENLGRAGFTVDEILASTAAVLNLARATGTDLPQAAEIAADTLRQFGMDASEMTRVADVMVASANNSAQTLEQLGESMSYAAPIAHEFGLNIEAVSKSLGVLANMGIKGSMAGTSLRRVMTSLADKGVRDNLRAIGVETENADRSFRDLGDIMIDIGRAMANMPAPDRLAFAKDLFDIRGMGAALKLMKAEFPELADAIDNAAGAAERAAKLMDSGLGGAFRRMTSALEGIQIAFGEALNPQFLQDGEMLFPRLNRALDTVTGLTGKLIEWMEANREVVRTIAIVTMSVFGLGAVLLASGLAIQFAAFAFGGLATATAAAGAVLGGVLALLAAIATPVGMVAAAAIAASAAWLYFSGTLGEAISGSMAMLGEMAGVFATTIGGITDALLSGDTAAAADIMWKGLHLAWMKGTQPLKEAWVGFQLWFTDITTGLAGVLIDAVAMMKSAWTSGINAMRKAWESFAASGFTEGAADIIAPIMAKIYGVDTEDVRANLKQDFQSKREDLPGKLAEIDAETEASKQDIEDQRQKRREALEANRQQSRIDAGDAMARQQRELAEAEQALAEARQAAAGSLEEAGGRDKVIGDAKKRIQDLLGGMAAGQAKGSSFGTFSAMTAARMGDNAKMLDVQKRQLDIQQEIARNTRRPGLVGA